MCHMGLTGELKQTGYCQQVREKMVQNWARFGHVTE